MKNKTIQKGAAILLLVLTAASALLYHSIYPLDIGLNSGFIADIPLAFWPVLVLLMLVAFFLSLSVSSELSAFAFITLISIIINYRQYLHFNFTGGDSEGEIARWFVIRNSPRFTVEMFDYFQWPLHFIYFEVLNKILSLPLIDMVRMSYFSLYLLFTVSLVYLFHSHMSRTLYWSVASLTYVFYMMVFLNNQLVPQLFALVLLLYLFSLGKITSLRDRFVQLAVYTGLVLSHPFFFVFYLFFVIGFPFVKGTKDSLTEFGAPDAPVYDSLLRTLYNPIRSLKKWIRDGSMGFLTDSLPTLLVLSVIYAFFFFFRFQLFNDKVYDLLSKEANSEYGSGTVLGDVLGLFLTDSGAAVAGPEPRLLYSLSSQSFHRLTSYAVMAIFLSLLFLGTVVFVLKSTRDISPTMITIGLTGIAYYITGFFLPILGPRGLQLALLPTGALIAGRHDHGKIIKAVFLVTLVLSPIIGLNGISNASIAGGGNTQSYQAHEAGEYIVQHSLNSDETVLKYPKSGLPPELTSEQDQAMTTVEELSQGYETVPSMLVYGPRQVHAAARYRHDCNFAYERRNVVYDNGVEILKDSPISTQFKCVPE